jgi:thiol-disulfide isomerase/thioredoxin
VEQAIWTDEPDLNAARKAIDAFLEAAPDDARGARLISMLASALPTGSDEQIALYERVQKQYPDTRAAKMAGGKIRQVTSIGKPFELAFTDAITGREINMRNLHGKVVIIDFWATWCGPCVAEMPHLKELYKQYRDHGVEFIGVSLDQPEDQGGLEALKKFVDEKEISWPQYYQGKGWDSEFSGEWGINGIPALFAIDKDGNLRSVDARGKLDELIPQLLAE